MMTLWILFCRMTEKWDTVFTFYAKDREHAERRVEEILQEHSYERLTQGVSLWLQDSHDTSTWVYEKVVGKQEKRWYPHLYMKNRKQRGPLPMETNEKLKMALLQETEKELLKMIDD
ncbi:MAG: hypothetical protein ACJ797_00015 [Ktedonobacteraceae bacterium]